MSWSRRDTTTPRRVAWRMALAGAAAACVGSCLSNAGRAQPAPPPAGPLPGPPAAGGPYAVVTTAAGIPEILVPGGAGAGGYSSRNGLQLRFSPQWPGKFGYQRLRVAVSTNAAAPADRQITLAFRCGNWRTQGRDIVVEQEGTLPAGATTATIDLAVPRYVDWQLCGIEAWVDGRKDPELEAGNLPLLRQGPSETMALLWTPPSEPRPGRFFDQMAEGQVTSQELPFDELPTEWVHYSALDVVAMPALQLPRLREAQPDAFIALLRWVRAGGTLALVATGENWAHVADVELVLRQAESPSAASTDEPAVLAPAGPWHGVPLGERAQQPVESTLALQGWATVFENDPTAAEDLDALWRSLQEGESRQVPPGATSDAWFVVRPWGLGAVAAFAEPLRSADSRWVRFSPLRPRLWWSQRHGFLPDAGSPEFNNWLIPGVGVAPIGMFQLLVSAFVILIGPVNYFWLMRRKQLPLLVITAPLGAAAVTILLFGYGLLSDGFGVQMRVRSLTWLDQPAGEAASWARCSYFAALAPDEGMTLPRNVAVTPIVPGSGAGRRSRRAEQFSQREVVWDDAQRLTRGWLPTRTPIQYLQTAAGPSAAGLRITDLGERIRVVNELQTEVLQCAVQTEAGELYWLESLAPGGVAEVARADVTQVLAKLRALFAEHEPAYPVGAPAPSLGNRGYYGPYFSGSILESFLSAISSPLVRELGDRSYVAVTAAPVAVPLGVEDAAQEASFHVVRGRW